MMELCAAKIDANPELLQIVRENATRIPDPRIKSEWERHLETPWPELRAKLLAKTEVGDQLRQNAPLGGILSNAERLQFFV